VSSFKERIFHFGEDQNLLGILTEPATPADSSKPVILFLNAGVVHHIGPFRLGTEFARTLADDGFRSFRFDLSGLGDSNLGKSQVNAEQRFIDDAKAAMDTLQAQLGAATRFIIFGLCTGADNAHKVTAVDTRINGAIFIDGYTYPSPRYYWQRILPVLLSPKRIFGIVMRLFIKPAQTEAEETIEDSIFTWSMPPRTKAVEEWTQMLRNNVQMLFIYTGGTYFFYNYEAQLLDAIPILKANRDKVTTKLFSTMDHTFSLAQHRQQLLVYLRQWLQRF
jgi:pimeloyl-ACP methyl ester carboxylesterase